MFHRTHLYTVHFKPATAKAPEDIVFVREGFNFWAFFFTVFWALYYRTWIFAILCGAWGMVLGMVNVAQMMTPVSLGVLQVGISAIFGYMANDELRESLQRRGYSEISTVSGENRLRAEQRFFDHYTPA